MYIYFLLLAFLAILAFVIYNNNLKSSKSKVYTVCAAIILFIVMAFRAPSVGTDVLSYCELYRIIAFSNWSNIFTATELASAPGYILFCKLVSLVSLNQQAIIVASSAIIIICIAYFIYYNSSNVVFSFLYFLVLYFYCSSMNGSRQFMAMGICLVGMTCILKSKRIVGYVLLIIAILIHNTAFIMIPFALITKKQMTIRYFKKVETILIVFGLLIRYIYMYIVNFFIMIFPRYGMYFGDSIHSFNDTGQGRKIIITLIYLVVLCIFLIKLPSIKKLQSTEELSETLNQALIVSLGIEIGLFFPNMLLISRMEDYFTIYMICFIPKIIKCFKLKQRMYIYMFSLLILMIPFYIQLKAGINGVTPYQFFWQ